MSRAPNGGEVRSAGLTALKRLEQQVMNSSLVNALDGVRRVLDPDDRVAYAIVFGSTARGSDHALSDVDVAVGLSREVSLDRHERELLSAQLSSELGHPVDLVFTEETPPGLAFRIFKDGITAVEHDRAALVSRRAKAIVEYLDFRYVEALCTEGVLKAARGGR